MQRDIETGEINKYRADKRVYLMCGRQIYPPSIPIICPVI